MFLSFWKIVLQCKWLNAIVRCLFALFLGFSPAALGQTTSWDDERILRALKEANKGLPMFRHREKVGDYEIVNVHEETYGMFLAGVAYTDDNKTGTRLYIEYRLSRDFKQCQGRVWTRSKGEPPAAKHIFSTNGLAAAEAAAKKRCENFAGP